MATLTFHATDSNFKNNLMAIREAQIRDRKFGSNDFDIHFVDGKVKAAKSAYVKGDGKTFSYDGYRVGIETVVRVDYRL